MSLSAVSAAEGSANPFATKRIIHQLTQPLFPIRFRVYVMNTKFAAAPVYVVVAGAAAVLSFVALPDLLVDVPFAPAAVRAFRGADVLARLHRQHPPAYALAPAARVVRVFKRREAHAVILSHDLIHYVKIIKFSLRTGMQHLAITRLNALPIFVKPPFALLVLRPVNIGAAAAVAFRDSVLHQAATV